MIIKTPQKTGDPYVDSCFQFDFEEFDEPRVWHEIASLKDIPLIADTDKNKALAIAEAAIQEFKDYSFLYYWIGKLRGQLNYAGEPKKTYLEGLQKGRNKPILCGGIAMWEFEHKNLAEAVKWWIKSCAIQLSCSLSKDGFSFLNLAYVSEGLGLSVCQTTLLEESNRLQSIAFDSIGANQRYSLAYNQGNQSIKNAISLLCNFYLTKSVPDSSSDENTERNNPKNGFAYKLGRFFRKNLNG